MYVINTRTQLISIFIDLIKFLLLDARGGNSTSEKIAQRGENSFSLNEWIFRNIHIYELSKYREVKKNRVTGIREKKIYI